MRFLSSGTALAALLMVVRRLLTELVLVNCCAVRSARGCSCCSTLVGWLALTSILFKVCIQSNHQCLFVASGGQFSSLQVLDPQSYWLLHEKISLAVHWLFWLVERERVAS